MKKLYIWRNKMIGREEEIAILDEALQSDTAELVAVYGRRRAGKTYMIREHFKNQILFQFTGIREATLKEQLDEFNTELNHQSKIKFEKPKDWFDAFRNLRLSIEQKRTKKKIIFLDELPWMATNKSRFLPAFESFWNGWASSRKDILVIICGSAASWMIKKIEKDKGGLYNRVTRRIHLKPFNLYETEQFLLSKRINLQRLEIIQLYMVFGGIPHYLKEIRPGESPGQSIQRISFSKNGLLLNEYTSLFDSLFGKGSKHAEIVSKLAGHIYGISRTELIKLSGMDSGGGFSDKMDDLIHSGFVEAFIPFQKKAKDIKYRLVDPFCLFYHKFMKSQTINNWAAVMASQNWKSWSGIAFEVTCLYHKHAIVKALKLDAINTYISTWYILDKVASTGAQIDLLIDRADKCINLCEIKFNQEPILFTGKDIDAIQLKRSLFVHYTRSKKTIFNTLITASGYIPNQVSSGTIHNHIKGDALFIPL